MSYRFQHTVYGLLSAGLVVGCASLPQNAWADETSHDSSIVDAIEHSAADFEPPPGSDRGSPSRQTDAGTREPCGDIDPQTDGVLTALFPGNAEAWTVDSHPTVWAYIPAEAEDIESMTLTWRSESGEEKEPISIPIPDELPGVMAVPMAETEPGLELGQTYFWIWEMQCQNASPFATGRFVMGAIHRVAPSSKLSQALAAVGTSREQALAYAQNGIWHDALTLLGRRYQAKPNNSEAAADWMRFLQALELDLQSDGIDFNHQDIGERPIVY